MESLEKGGGLSGREGGFLLRFRTGELPRNWPSPSENQVQQPREGARQTDLSKWKRGVSSENTDVIIVFVFFLSGEPAWWTYMSTNCEAVPIQSTFRVHK